MKNLTIILILPLFFGCASNLIVAPLVSPIVQGVIMWREGEAHKYYNLDSDSMYRAAKRTARAIGYSIERDDLLANNSYYIVAGENDKLKIKIDKVEKKVTKVSIRVNIMGDVPYAEMFYEQLDKQVNVIEFDSLGRPT